VARVHIVGRGVSEGRTYDQAAVWARYGVSPAELPDWKALAGDPTDELPGVPGVGGKTAAALVRRFGSVAGLLARLEEVRPERVREALEERRETLPLWRDLAKLRDDVPLPAGPRFSPLTSEARARVRKLFEELEFRSLIPRLDAL
jgi:DNA polymerase-1